MISTGGIGGRSRSGPAHWRWRQGEVAPGPAVVFDIDGVLADGDHRQHLLFHEGSRRRNWKAFFDAATDDALIEEVARLTELLDPSLCRVLLTARPETMRELTLEWLARHDLKWELLVMRPEGEFGPSPEAKRSAVRELRDYGFDLRIAFDDDRRNVAMFHGEGIPCIYIHSGYYEL